MTLHKGYRNKSRSKYRKKVRKRGLGSIEKYLLDFEPGDKVEIIADPSQHRRGMPHRRYHGRTGKIVDTRGRCFVVEVRLRNATKKSECPELKQIFYRHKSANQHHRKQQRQPVEIFIDKGSDGGAPFPNHKRY